MTFFNTKRLNTNTILGLLFITILIFAVFIALPMVSFGGGDGGGDSGADLGTVALDNGMCDNDFSGVGSLDADGVWDGDIASDPDTRVTSNTCTLDVAPSSMTVGSQDAVLTVSNTGGVTSMTVSRNSTTIGTISTTFTDTTSSELSPGNYTYAVSGSRTWLADPRLPQNGCEAETDSGKDGIICLLYNQTTYLHTTSCTDNLIVTGAPPPPPTQPTFTATPTTINSGGSSTLSWSCSASTSSSGVNFSTGGATSGSAGVAPSSTTQYSVICSNGGQASRTVTVLNPALTITATPSLVKSGSTSVIAWSTTNTNSCTVTENNSSISDSWSGLSGSQTSSAIAQETIYALACTTDGGPVSETATVRLLPTFEEF